MTLNETLDNVLAHLHDARQSMQRLAAFSEDWVAKGLIEAEFSNLEGMVREFARYQLQMDPDVIGDTDVE